MARFVYYNDNPEKTKTQDCITRAISLASGIPYETIRKKLLYTSILYDCPRLVVCCYRHLIEDVLGGIPVYCKDMTIEEFADENPTGIFIVRIEGHVSVIRNGEIWDIWDCRDQICDKCWFMGYTN